MFCKMTVLLSAVYEFITLKVSVQNWRRKMQKLQKHNVKKFKLENKKGLKTTLI